jgi:hypothetical protein
MTTPVASLGVVNLVVWKAFFLEQRLISVIFVMAIIIDTNKTKFKKLQ